MATTFESIIDKAGVSTMARLLGVDESHVRVMKTRKSVPPEYWSVLVERRDDLGMPDLELIDLHRMRLDRFRAEKQAVAS